jgi:hypothetical protein
MNSIATFDSTKESLQTLLGDIETGITQLPDFQRGWIWDDDRIQSLLASVSLSFPIGAVMMLETGNEDVRLKPRLVEGVNLTPEPKPDHLILDGQQRLTALYQALRGTNVVNTRDLKGNDLKRWYYIDIAKALDPRCEREECIRGLHENKQFKNFRGELIEDFSSPEKEYETGLFPLNRIFNYGEWMMGFQEYWDYDKVKIKLFNDFTKEIINRFEQYQIPLIMMKKETPKEAICIVFEKVNTGGVSLNVFELLTATLAAENFNLREDWEHIKQKLKLEPVLQKIENTDLLQAVSLLVTHERHMKAIAAGVSPDNAPAISCKRKDILKLTKADYEKHSPRVVSGFEKAAKLLGLQKIFFARDVPYRTQIIPFASVVTLLGDVCENEPVRQKLFQWYWSGVLGELYGGANDSRFAKDVPEILAWIEDGPEPASVSDAHFSPSRLYTLHTRNSAAYKGIFALMMKDGGLDFISGQPIDFTVYKNEGVDIHHIFPEKWCTENGKKKFDNTGINYDCIVNKAPLSYRTNRKIGGNAPSVYLDLIQRQLKIAPERLDEIVATHNADPALLRADNFESFFNARKEAILQRIEKAMGKPIARDAVEESN